MPAPTGHLNEREWDWARDHLPIACVDLLPVRRGDGGAVAQVGLIRRSSPFGERWCHLGGRIRYGETVLDAAARHLVETLHDTSGLRIARSSFFVNQFFPQSVAGAGVDPRKHAVAVCHLVECEATANPLPHGEAEEFRWFRIDELPVSTLWPGTDLMIGAVPTPEPTSRPGDDLAYAALSDRSLSHNELMWQTPVLAMTAMAFLMTIALGDGRPWARAVAALLSAVTAVVSVQLMAKHSHSQLQDTNALWEMEKELHLRPVHAPPRKGRTDRGLVRWSNRHLDVAEARLVGGRSRRWWLVAMMLFGVVSVGVAVQALIRAFLG